MKEKDIKFFIEDILESIEKIEKYTKGMKKEEFLADDKTLDAVFKRFENMGEAVKNIPQDFRERYSDIPWREIAGFRDNLVHEYFGIDAEEVWKTVKEDIPQLKRKVYKIKENF
ncbi:DUF86 domain-containing protein [candidate division WOR-3 bacterium]|nr:DUF86 domain-containing protein [candidate division WOR-3 bacterium]